MKRILLLVAVLWFLPLAGCVTTETPPPVTYPPQTVRPFSTGITITFKAQPPTDVTDLISIAGVVPVTDLVFTIENYDRNNSGQNAFLEASLKCGATLTRK